MKEFAVADVGVPLHAEVTYFFVNEDDEKANQKRVLICFAATATKIAWSGLELEMIRERLVHWGGKRRGRINQ